MSMKRYARLSKGFSRKVENYEHLLAIYFMYYKQLLPDSQHVARRSRNGG